MSKKEKQLKKEKTKKRKERKSSYLKQVKQEMKMVTFPKKKEIVKYTFATILIVVLMIGFFELLNLALSVVKGMF